MGTKHQASSSKFARAQPLLSPLQLLVVLNQGPLNDGGGGPVAPTPQLLSVHIEKPSVAKIDVSTDMRRNVSIPVVSAGLWNFLTGFPMFVFYWNARGAGYRSFPTLIRDLRARYHFQILLVLEPRISGTKASMVIRKMDFSKNYRVGAVGFLGGLWLLWDKDCLSVDVLSAHP